MVFGPVLPLTSSISSSSAFDVMVALTRSSLPWVPHTWMSGTNPLQTPRAWFWGTHRWAISAVLLAGGVSRTVGNVLVFGPPLPRGIERRFVRQSSWDGYSVCSGLFWGERWWSVGVVAADGVHPGLGCILQSCSGRWLSSDCGWGFYLKPWELLTQQVTVWAQDWPQLFWLPGILQTPHWLYRAVPFQY